MAAYLGSLAQRGFREDPSTSGYRGRLAPSPTGLLHVGHARTFWTAFQRVRQAGGALVMRLEDLDAQRSRPEFAEAALEDLRWLGIRWQEGPDKGGTCGPYEQSRRYGFYLQAWQQLYCQGYLFPCRCSRKDLASALSAPHEMSFAGDPASGNGHPASAAVGVDEEPLYPGTCRNLTWNAPQLPGHTQSEAANLVRPIGCNWRFRVPEGVAVEFFDQNLGPQRFIAGEDFGDFLVWRRDNLPSYQLACAVDDEAMKITEVVRGADLLKSTARQILLQRALGYATPRWFHCALVADHNGQRLAKRHDALSIRALRRRGLTPMNILSAELPVMA